MLGGQDGDHPPPSSSTDEDDRTTNPSPNVDLSLSLSLTNQNPQEIASEKKSKSTTTGKWAEISNRKKRKTVGWTKHFFGSSLSLSIQNPINPKPIRNWANLPSDVIATILQKLGAVDILENAQNVCSNWFHVCKDPSMWRVVDMHNLFDKRPRSELVKMCKDAVDRSQGQLVDINIEFFGTDDRFRYPVDDLLYYIADRASQLKSLQLVCCLVSKEVFDKLPFLEELHLHYTWPRDETIQIIGICCPLLTSFELDEKGCTRLIDDCDGQAKAIAENLPRLRHLSPLGMRLTESGLKAILDECIHLESIDLRKCDYILRREVLERCVDQIKDVRLPWDSTEDYKFDDPIYHEPGGSHIGL